MKWESQRISHQNITTNMFASLQMYRKIALC